MRFGKGDEVDFVSLSMDGRWLAVAVSRHPQASTLKIFDMQVGELREIAPWDRKIKAVAVSPDGSQIACLRVDRTGCDVVIGEPGHPLLPLWHADEGGWMLESTVSWSPDGRYVAVTWLDGSDSIDDEDAVTVVETNSGTVVQQFTNHNMLPASAGTWASAGVLVTAASDGLHFFDCSDRHSTLHAFPPRHLDVIAMAQERLVCRSRLPDGTFTERLVTCALDGNDVRLLYQWPEGYRIRECDVAGHIVDCDMQAGTVFSTL
jgi:WD40 repeat protein